uniref:Uncharacterized protein n=1 Tax=Anguilla anguilla TaxID=7936 RepID=A0A0E9SQQ2_ANGAN
MYELKKLVQHRCQISMSCSIG